MDKNGGVRRCDRDNTCRSTSMGQPVDTALIDSGSANDWPTYHGSYKSYHYSPLDQINAGNVRTLEVAWIHVPGRSTRGLQSMTPRRYMTGLVPTTKRAVHGPATTSTRAR